MTVACRKNKYIYHLLTNERCTIEELQIKKIMRPIFTYKVSKCQII